MASAVVATHPDPGSLSNPYLRLLHAELERRGFRFRTLRGELAGAGEADLVHLNWLEFLVRSGGPLAGLRSWRRAGRLLMALRRLRRAGVGVVWTVHNLRPHEPEHPWLERALARRVAREADALVVHSQWAAERVQDSFGRERWVFAAPHAGYLGCLPEERRPRAQLRAELGLPPDGFVYLVFGQVRADKRVPAAVEAFLEVARPEDRLVVAGRPLRPQEGDAVRLAARGDPRVLLRLEHLDDELVPAYHLAADAAVLPYGELFTSGALMMALSYGLPCVAPARGSALESAAPPAIEPFEEGGLAAALARVRGRDAGREAAMAAADVSWAETADGVEAAYHAALAGAAARRPG